MPDDISMRRLDDEELVDLYFRYSDLRRKLVKLKAELDNVRELIRVREFDLGVDK